MTLFEAISPTARELLVLHCLPSRPRHFFVVGECHHCGVSKADFLKASRAATNASRRVLRQ